MKFLDRAPRLLLIFTLIAVAPGGLSASAQTDAADVAALIEQLDSDDVLKRVAAAQALGELGPRAAPAIDRLFELLSERKLTDRGAASWMSYSQALGSIGAPALEALTAGLDSPDLQVFKGSCDGLRRLGTDSLPVLPKLIAMLEDTESNRAWAIMYVMEGWGPESRDATETIRPYLNDSDFQVQCIACRTLAVIGPAANSAGPQLVELLETGNTSVKGNAALTLGAVGPIEGLDSVSPMVGMFTNFNDSIRERSLTGVGRLGEHAAEAAPQLRELLADTEYRNRARAAWALWRVSGETEEPIRRLIELTGSPDTNLTAIQRLGDMGPDGAEAVAHLTQLVEGGDGDEQYEAATALGRIGPVASAALPALRERLSSPDAFLVEAVQQAIRSIDSQ